MREVAPVSVFEDEFGASTVNGNVEEFLLEKVAALGRSDEKAAISAVSKRGLHHSTGLTFWKERLLN